MREESQGSGEVDENKILAAIGYLGILFLIPLLVKKDSEFCQFHAKQAMILFIIEVILLAIVWIPFLGWLLYTLVSVVALVGLIQALMGRKWRIPGIAELADKIKI